jgi:hypothetical protein
MQNREIVVLDLPADVFRNCILQFALKFSWIVLRITCKRWQVLIKEIDRNPVKRLQMLQAELYQQGAPINLMAWFEETLHYPLPKDMSEDHFKNCISLASYGLGLPIVSFSYFSYSITIQVGTCICFVAQPISAVLSSPSVHAQTLLEEDNLKF